MSSRAGLLSSTRSEVYKSRPVPSSPEELPVYLGTEFGAIGDKINTLLEGSVFTSLSEIPARNKEGMTILFKDKIKNPSYTAGGAEPEFIIDKPGLWMYFDKVWRRIPFDPEWVPPTPNKTI